MPGTINIASFLRTHLFLESIRIGPSIAISLLSKPNSKIPSPLLSQYSRTQRTTGRNSVRQRGLHQLPQNSWLVQLHLPVLNGAKQIREVTRFPSFEHDSFLAEEGITQMAMSLLPLFQGRPMSNIFYMDPSAIPVTAPLSTSAVSRIGSIR